MALGKRILCLEQSMWREGLAASFSASTFLGTKWGTYNNEGTKVVSVGPGVFGSAHDQITPEGLLWLHPRFPIHSGGLRRHSHRC